MTNLKDLKQLTDEEAVRFLKENREAVVADPQQAEFLGDVLSRRFEFDQALPLFEAAWDLKPDHLPYQLKWGITARHCGMIAHSKVYLEKLWEQYPACIDVDAEFLLTCLEGNLFPNVEIVLNHLAEGREEHPRIQLGKAILPGKMGKYQQSNQLLEPFLENPETRMEAQLAMIENLYMIEDVENWLGAIEDFSEKYPAHPMVVYWTVKIAEFSGTVFNQVQTIQETLNRYPEHTGLQLTLARVRWDQKFHDLAQEAFTTVLKTGGWSQDVQGLYATFLLDTARGEVDMTELEQLSQQPNFPLLPYYIGKIRFGITNENEKAEKCFEEAVQRLPEHVDAWKLLGETRLANENYETALQAFDTALGLSPDHPKMLEGKGFCAFHLGKFEEALVSLETSLKWLAMNTGALYLAGKIYFEEKQDFEAAREKFELAASVDPTDVRFAFSTAQAYEKLGNKDLAAFWGERAFILQGGTTDELDDIKKEAFGEE